VIHTDASSIITGGFGMSQGCGHIDFYPNGGTKQPGCNEGAIKSVIDSIGKERNVIHGIQTQLLL
jgi:pancreatic triacylglycerol lipase